jgi:precorrin-4 methylase
MHSHIYLHTGELRETKERLNERLSDDEVTQIQFRAGQDDLENVKQQLRDVEAKLADRSKECEALERKAALQVPPCSLLSVLSITDARDCSASVSPSPRPER